MNYPFEFTSLEQCQAQALIDEAARAGYAYQGNFKAPWLLSPIDAEVWKISKGEETRSIDGEFVNYYEFSWAATLSDGTNLVDSSNKSFLINLQKIVFLARELPGGPDTLSTHKLFFWSAKLFTRWLYLHQDIFNPRIHMLTKIKKEHLIDFFSALGQGGTVFALCYPQRFLQAVFPPALSRSPTAEELANPQSLNREDCQKVAKWLAHMGAMKKGGRPEDTEARYINMSFIANAISTDVDTVRGGPRWQLFLRQFTADGTVGHMGARRRSSGDKTEYARHRDLTDAETSAKGTSEKTLGKYYDDLKTLFSLHRHLPNVCPDPIEFRPKELRRLITSVSSKQSHTPWVPLNIALTYTTEALRWVHVYGEDLVTLFLHTYDQLFLRNLLISAPVPEKKNPTNADYTSEFKKINDARESFVSTVVVPQSLKELGLTGWSSYQHLDGPKAFKKLRNTPSMLDAVMVLVGAIAIVVSIVKPIRESELRSLKRDCLLFFEGDGYWLSQEVRKKNKGDARPLDARPIPVIAARALQLLRRLTDGLKQTINVTDPWILDSLFTLPSFGKYEAVITDVISPAQLNYTIDAFCDYVALPPDNDKRRWYIRIHEMRKSFLIVFFWTYRYASLDAARWIAGHENATHLYAYIQANFPGDELPAIEAEYASKVLRDYETTGNRDNLKNIEALHQEVCKHFSVRDVTWIDEAALKDWLELQFEKGEFEIHPYSLKNTKKGNTTVIAVRIRSLGQETFE